MKRINPRLAKKHRSYTVGELAERLDVHKHTVRGWLKKDLPAIDGAKPTLILGSDLQAWWGRQQKAAKRPCKPGQMYCFKCREPKAPALGMVEYAATNAATGNLKALCETCGTLMHQRVKLANVAVKMPGLDVQITQAPSSIEAARRYVANSIKREFATENGNDLNAILPKMSPLNPAYLTKKDTVFRRVSDFVEKFKRVGGQI